MVTFEGGSSGTVAKGTNGFSYAGTATTYSSTAAAGGSTSAQMKWTAGTSGWGTAHGEINLPAAVRDGGEIWIRGYYHFANPWSWASANGAYSGIKVMRLSTSAGGWLSIFTDSRGAIGLSNEPAEYQTFTGTLNVGTWQCLEMYVRLSASVSVFRIWVNGILIHEDKAHRTLAASDRYSELVSVMSVWNNNVAQNQTQYIDEFVITTDRPSQVDAKGNPMIGPIGGPLPLPAAPTNLTAAPFSSSQIHLAWKDNSPGETGFVIERKVSATGSWGVQGQVGANISSYQSTGLSASRTFYYRVKAINENGSSNYSNEVSATTLPAAAVASGPGANSAPIMDGGWIFRTGSTPLTISAAGSAKGFSIYDIRGRQVFFHPSRITNGTQKDIPLPSGLGGMLYVRFEETQNR